MKKLLLITTMLFLSGMAIAQCPMCKTALKSNDGKGHKPTVGNGINKGILFLLTAPYVLAGTVGFVWYKNRNKKKDA